MSTTYDIVEGYRVLHGTKVHTGYTLERYHEGGGTVRNPGTGEMVERKPTWALIGYYPNMKQCIATVVEELTLANKQVTTVEGYLNKATELGKQIGGRFAN